MLSETILVFDQGTTRCKICLLNLRGECIGLETIRNSEYRRHSVSWQSAQEWWHGATGATKKLLSRLDMTSQRVVALSVSGRAGAGVFLDNGGEVIVDPWLDQRHHPELVEIKDQFPDLALYAATLLSKLLWLRRNDAHLFQRIAHAMYAKDFLVFRLTGNAVTDPSSGPDGLDWPAQALRNLEIAPDLLPRPELPWGLAGYLTEHAASELGLSPGLPVAVGAHDGICANVGAGVIAKGEIALTLGTHGVSRTIIEAQPAEGVTRFYCYPTGKHVIGANALMAGRSLEWFLDQSPDARPDRNKLFQEYDDFVLKAEPGAGGASFYPYLDGQISPTLDRKARASFHGLTTQTTQKQMYQAVLEGASFAIAESFLQLSGWIPQVSRVSVTGSGAKSKPWVQLLANLINQPLETTDGVSESRGAAIFAAVLIGKYPTIEKAVVHMVQTEQTFNPDIELSRIYQQLFKQWRDHREKLRAER